MYTICRGCNNGFETDYGSKKYCNESFRMNIYKKRICKNCCGKIPNRTIIDGKKVNIQRRTYCLTCEPFKTKMPVDITERRKKDTEKQKRFYLKNAKAIKKAAFTKKKSIIDLTNGCQLCGYNRCIKNIAFHHVNPKEKSFNITAREFSFSKKRLVQELIKCIAVCHNCHGEIHDEIITREIVSQKHAELIDKLTAWK